MRKHKAVILINYFTEEELKKFEKFLKSPYHNTRKKPISLFKIIVRNKEKILANKLSNYEIFDKIYQEKKYNSNTLNDLMAQLYTLGTDFIWTESSKENNTFKHLSILEKFGNGGYKDLFENKKRQVEKIFKEQKDSSTFFHYLTFIKDLNSINYYQTFFRHNSRKISNDIDKLFIQCAISLINCCLIGVDDIFAANEGRNQAFVNKGNRESIRKIALHLFDEKFLDLIKPYNDYHYLLEVDKKNQEVFSDPLNKKKYFEYRSIVKNFSSKLPHDVMVSHYTKLFGYCRQNLGKSENNTEFIKEMNSLFYEIVEKKYYKYSQLKNFHHSIYLIFLIHFVRQKDIQSIQYLIDKCAPLLQESFVKIYRALSNAHIQFFAKNYKKTLDYLSETKANHVGEDANIKVLFIKTHFHLGNTEQVLSLTEAYIKFLKSPVAISIRILKNRVNFANFIKKIILLQEKNKHEEIKYLFKQIEETKLLDERNWLLEIINQHGIKNQLKNKSNKIKQR